MMMKDGAELCEAGARRARATLVLKITFEVMAWLAALALLAYAGRAVFAAPAVDAPAARVGQAALKGGEG